MRAKLGAGALLSCCLATMAVAGEVTVSPLLGDHDFSSATQPYDNSTVKGVHRARQDTLGLGYRWSPHWGVELDVGRSTTHLLSPLYGRYMRYKSVDMNGLYRFNPSGWVQPFVLLGGGRAMYNADQGLPFMHEYAQAGGGLMLQLTPHFALRSELRYLDQPAAHWHDVVGLLGVEFRIGSVDQAAPAADTSATTDSAAAATPDAEAAPAAPAPVEAAAAPEPAPAPAVAVADDDHDGVPNNLDKCPNTPAGVQVDAQGCPLDSDHDGVPDYLDKCPNTKPGALVDAQGCYVMVTHMDKMRLDIQFESGQAVIHGDASSELRKVADFMQRYPSVDVTIDGYTDNVGDARANRLLSQRRAEAVRRSLIGLGVAAGRLRAVGHGADDPIASNATAAGRLQNRRVEASANAEESSIRMKN